jgi:hypothetical protein
MPSNYPLLGSRYYYDWLSVRLFNRQHNAILLGFAATIYWFFRVPGCAGCTLARLSRLIGKEMFNIYRSDWYRKNGGRALAKLSQMVLISWSVMNVQSRVSIPVREYSGQTQRIDRKNAKMARSLKAAV